MGRPKGFNGKCEQYRLRLSQEENYILKKLAEKEGLSKAEVLRKGLKIFNYLSKNGGIIGYPEIEENDNDINGYPKTKVIIIGYPKTRSKSSKNTILGLFWTKNGIIVGYPLIQEVTPLLLREKKIKYIKTFATPYRLDNIGYPKTKWRNFMRNSISEVEFICIFADNLSDIMDEVGISQRQLAKKAHITEAALSRYLNKQRMPNMRTFMNLCYALQCEYSDLLPTYSMVE